MATTQFVNVGKIPGEVFKLPFRKNEKVSALAKRADISINGGDVQLNGRKATENSIVTAGGTVLVINKIKGN